MSRSLILQNLHPLFESTHSIMRPWLDGQLWYTKLGVGSNLTPHLAWGVFVWLDFHIIMCILVSMNIYISPKNEERLREYQDPNHSMSGLINGLLEEYFSDVETAPAVAKAIKAIAAAPTGETE